MVALVHGKNVKMLRQLNADSMPVVQGTKKTVQEHNRLACPICFEIEVHHPFDFCQCLCYSTEATAAVADLLADSTGFP